MMKPTAEQQAKIDAANKAQMEMAKEANLAKRKR